MKKKVLVITRLFPNEFEPVKGIFVKKMLDVQSNNESFEYKIISPIPYFPSGSLFRWFKRWHHFTKIPYIENKKKYKIWHPRFFKPPHPILFSFIWIFYFFTVYWTIKRNLIRFDIIHSHWLYPDGFVSAIISKMLKKPLVIHCHESNISVYNKKNIINFYIKFLFNKS